ncbi:MAG TPA: O-antigen ligase family protein [Bryobacteraceae bacterium]|nr:O-antigen ligase family protein [Bryobacteraceae bacterium]
MNSALTQRRAHLLAPLAFGAWAAAIAVAHGAVTKALLAAPAVLLPLAWWTLHKPARWLALFFAAALLLPPLPIPIGDSGPHPCLALAALGLFAGMLWLGEWRVPLSGLNTAFLALAGALLASVAMAAFHSGTEAAAGSLARVALFCISVYVFFYTAYGPARESAISLRFLYWIAAASALFACVDFYYQFPAPAGFGPQFVWLDSGVYRRAQGLFYEASTLGNFCAFFLVMIAVAFTRPRTEAPVSRKALVAGGAVFFAALVLSYSRASLLNVLVASAVLVWINRRRVRLGRLALVLGCATAAGALLVWKLFPQFAEMYWIRLSGSTEYFFTATEGILSGRVASWRTLLEWVTVNPWQTLFGIGYKTLPYSGYLGGPVVADNMYLSLLVETGIAGLTALVWLNVAILRAAARAARSADRQASFCGAWMLCFWSGQVVQMLSGDLLTYWRVLPLYFWVLALAVRA